MELLQQQLVQQLLREATSFCSKRIRKTNTEWLAAAGDDRSELVQKLRALLQRVQQAEASFEDDELSEEIRSITTSVREIRPEVPKRASFLYFQVEQALGELRGRQAVEAEHETNFAQKNLIELSFEQTDAIENDGSLFLQGRSGTGKTLVLVHRIIQRREGSEQSGKVPSQLFITKSALLRDTVVQQLEAASVPVIALAQAFAPGNAVLCLSWNQLAAHFGLQSGMNFQEFQAQFFPHLQGSCHLSALSAKAVWTEFTCALRPFTGWHWNGIPLEDYLKSEVSGQGVHLTLSDRRAIHKAFTLYTIMKENSGRHDEVDIAMKLQHLLRQSSFDEIYVDEVQDFAPAQLNILLQICSRPEGFTVAGDTCQTINPGCAFCFKDIMNAHRKTVEGRGQAAQGCKDE